MNLPDISIPIAGLEQIPMPELIHPFIVHFAVALPVVIIVLEIVNLFARRKLLGSISFFFMVVFSVVLLGAYLSGNVDTDLINSLGGEAKETLIQHKTEGVYIFYASLALLVIKILSVMVRKAGVKILFIIFLLVFSAVLANVALKGTKLVYKYSVVCQKAQAKSHKETSTHQKADTTQKEQKTISQPKALPAPKSSHQDTTTKKETKEETNKKEESKNITDSNETEKEVKQQLETNSTKH